MHRRFVFKKDCGTGSAVIPSGSEMEIVGERIFMSYGTNGGQILDPRMHSRLMEFVMDDKMVAEYLTEQPLKPNKV